MMPLSATSFLMRFVSGMEYALLMRTTPSSSALASPDGGSISANASSAADQMHRVNTDRPSKANEIGRKRGAEYSPDSPGGEMPLCFDVDSAALLRGVVQGAGPQRASGWRK